MTDENKASFEREVKLELQLADMTRDRDWHKRAYQELVNGLADTASLRNTISQLQATLTARENDIDKLKAEINETWIDERGTVWTRPTAWAYAMVCKARDKHEQDAARLRKALERIVIEAKKEPSIIGVVEVHSIAHRALKEGSSPGSELPGDR